MKGMKPGRVEGEMQELEEALFQELDLGKDGLKPLKKFFSDAPAPMILLNRDLKILDANAAACELLEIDKARLLSKFFHEFLFMYSGDLSKEKRNWLVLESSASEEYVIETVKGTLKQIELYPLLEIGKHRLLFMLKDVTSDRQLEWERSLHLSLFEKVINHIIDGLVLFDDQAEIINVNQSFCRTFGVERDQLVGRSFAELFPKNGESSFDRFWNTLLETGSFFGIVLLESGNRRKWFEMSTSANVFNGLYMSILRDVTDKRMMVQEKLNSDERFRKVFHSTLDGMILWNEPNGCHCPNIIAINQAAQSMFQIHPDKSLKEQLEHLLVTFDGETCSFYEALLKSSSREDMTVIWTVPKTERTIELYTIPNLLIDGHLTIFRDITERLKMEDQLRKSDMLNVVGELAAGIAHEIRNPMTSLKGFIQLLKGSVEGHDMYFNIIMAELERIESIVNEFLVLAKPQAVTYKTSNVIQIMRETIELLYAQAMMDNVQFSTCYESDVLPIYCEPNQIKQVFINIIKNAIEVMPRGGTVTVAIHQEEPDWVKISIKDEGAGIPEERLKKLGQPFYTTKERGTGLGLMISYKIIKEHGGRIEVESKIGEGTVFHVILPQKKRKK